uniref:Large ribosomal subunit protein uL4 C-terminal domain-containing protein n=1 Tax=Pipistrellus kuhlii TaxID=59472 RepID=A0A7J7VUW0_PIPKU|nr:hypothetical protein mPipKuh1_008314 [Pipistrellus kuhlii]
MLSTDLSRIWKSPEFQRALHAPCEKIHHRVLRKNPLKNLRIMLNLNPYAKTMRQNTILRQAKNHRLRMDKAAAVLEAKSDEKPVVGRKERRLWALRSRRSLWWGERLQLPRNQQLRRSPQKRNPPQRKRSPWHKLKLFIPERSSHFTLDS